MHDDFLYQLRRAPSPTFARRLKAKLDRASHVPWRGFRIGMLLFLCGAAFALVSPTVRHTTVAYLSFRQSTGTLKPAAIAVRPTAPADRAIETNSSARPAVHANPPGSFRPGATKDNDRPVAAPHDAAHEVHANAPLASPTATSQIIYGPSPAEVAEQTVNTRQGLFKVMQWEMAPFVDMMRGGTPFDAVKAEQDARRISQTSALIVDVFRADTRRITVPTHARAEIWTNWADFTAKADDLTRAADAAAAISHEGDRAVALRVMAAVGAACTACHDSYRTASPAD